MRHFLLIACIAVAAMWLCGCVRAKQTHTPTGGAGYTITCTGKAANWRMCYWRAKRICGATGYDVIDRSLENKPVVVDDARYGLYASQMKHRKLVIACR